MNIGHVKFIPPKHPTLRPLIKGYYVHSCDDPDFCSKVTFYQNITTTISIYKDSQTSAKGRIRKQHFRKDNGYHALLVGMVDKYQEVHFYGPLDRLAIVFYPLGINHFISVPLSDLLEQHYSNFNYFGDEFNQLLHTVYPAVTLDEKRDLLDTFFMKNYSPFGEPGLLKAVDILINASVPVKVDELAQQIAVSRRTLLRKFKNHTGYTIEEYKAVIKFRKALLSFHKNQDSFKLGQIALESNYYDQADFNHQIKYRSDLTPKELFAQLNLIDNTLFWKL